MSNEENDKNTSLKKRKLNVRNLQFFYWFKIKYVLILQELKTPSPTNNGTNTNGALIHINYLSSSDSQMKQVNKYYQTNIF